MNALDTAAIRSADVWIDHPRGRLFARAWADARNARDTDAAFVLFHDSLGCVELWREFPAQLCAATGRRVIAYDRLGFGKSDARNDILRPGFVADEAETYFPLVCERLEIGEFIAFGHSVGGGMAVHCAARHASRCIAVVTVAAQAFAAEETLQGISAAKKQFEDASRFERLRKYHGDKAKWVLDAWTETWLSAEFASWSLAGVLPRVSCPVLALHGELDEYGSRQHPEMIGRLCGGPARVEILPDTHHVPHREKPEVVIALVSEFLSTLG